MPQDATTNTLMNGFHKPSLRPSLPDVCAQLHGQVEAFLQRNAKSELEKRVQGQTRVSLGVIKEALERYHLPSLSLSYNGGKDCLVLLILFLSSLHEHLTADKGRQSSPPSSIPSIYAYPPDPFPAVTSFVNTSSRAYHLDLAHIPTNPRPSPNSTAPRITLRDAFAAYLSTRPNIRAIFVGTRRTDPHGGNLTFFDPTDHGWPEFMRIHPVIDWKLAEIWAFLRCEEIKNVEYCGLYDQGYTSLGGLGDTAPNPVLKKEDGSYRPALELEVDGEERLGRE